MVAKKEVKLSNQLNILRAGVLGANDGIVSVAGVVIGVAAAGSSNRLIFIAGLAAVLAGAFSMSGGEYVSVSTQSDTEKAAIEQQKKRLSEHFDEEKADVVKYYRATGISEELSWKIADEVMEKRPLEITVDQKFNLEVGEYTNPWHAAISSFCSFVIGSLLPLLAIVLIPSPHKIMGTVLAVTIALFITGYTSAKLGGAPRRPAVIRNVFVCLLTMAVTYAIGYLLHV